MKKISYKKRKFNGQDLYFPTKKQWEEIFDSKSFNCKTISNRLLTKLQNNDVPLSLKYNSINISLGFFGAYRHILSYPILVKDEHQQRVYLEKVTCNNCDWVGNVANPFVTDIYLGISDKECTQELMLSAKENFKKVSCPKCLTVFNRHFIWAEPIIDKPFEL